MRTTRFFIHRAALLLLAMLLTATTAWAKADGHKIVVIADPHVMAPELLTNTSNTDWTTYIAGSRKLIDYSQVLFDQTVSNISEMAEKPELVLIVGDLTKDGEQASHDYVKGKLDELKTAGIPTLVIPGNHDWGTADAKVYGETTSDAITIADAAAFATLYADYGYGASSDRLENTLTYACEPIEGLVVIGIDSGTSGVLSETTLDWVCAKATAARAAGKQVIAMMHHPLIPHITGGDMFVETVSVANSANVRNRLADAGIRTIFTGHFHTSDIAKDWNADKTETIYDVTTGSLCSYPCDYRVVTLNNTMTEMEIETRNATGDNTITADAAKERLTTVMTNMAKAKIQAKLENEGQSAYVAAIAANMMGPKMANAYVYHAEGNENSNDDAQTLLTELNSTFSTQPAYQALVNSMLLDKSNYGTDREDQTNDRTLSIDMPLTWDGSGSENDPYLIKSTFQLNLLAQRVNAGNNYTYTYFKLNNDITYSHKAANEEGSDTENNFTAIGNADNTFKGHFDGNGKTISGIRIYTNENYQGLFGYLGINAEVENVILNDAHITGNDKVGGIAGHTYGALRNNLVLGSTINSTSSNSYSGAIFGSQYNNNVVNNYYNGCTRNGDTNGIGYGYGDYSYNNGAVQGYLMTLGTDVTSNASTIGNYHVAAEDATITLNYSGEVPSGKCVVYTITKSDTNPVETVAVAESAGDYTLKMPACNVTVSAAAVNQYTITYNGVPNGYTIVFDESNAYSGSGEYVYSVDCIIDGTTYEMDRKYNAHLQNMAYTFTFWGTPASIQFVATMFGDEPSIYESEALAFSANGGDFTMTKDTKSFSSSYIVTTESIDYPTTYTSLNPTITLNRPIKTGYAFYGWTGTELTAATKDVTITSGSTGNREYTATWGGVIDIKNCTASVPDQTMERFGGGEDYPYIYFKFEDAEYNPTSNVIGEEITDGNYTLKLGIDYEFGRITFAEPSTHSETVNPCKPGDKCLVEINGTGDYAGTIYAPFTIIGPTVSNQTWGDLTWSLSNGELSISLKNPENGDKPMPELSRENYPWYPFASYITSVTINKDNDTDHGITTVGAHAFQGTDGIHETNPYQYIVTVTLPSSLTTIGEDAFAYCTGATITIPTSVTSIGDGAFMEVLKVKSSLYDNADNTGLITLLSAAKKNDVTLQGRTLWKDGEWNTICLPFDMDADQVTAQLGPDALKELDVEGYYNVTTGNPWPGNTGYDGYRQTGFDATSGKLYLYFKDATSIKAGKPYIIKWDKPDNYVTYNGQNAATCSDLVSPEFTGVKVWSYDPATNTTSGDGYVTFQGTYAPIEWTAENKSVLFLGVGKNSQNQDVSTLYYPNGTAETTLNAFRAYFQLNNGLMVGTSNGVKEFKLSFNEEDNATSMYDERCTMYDDSLTPALSKGEEAIYNLAGQRLSKMQRGINIVNGKKIFK